MLFGFEYTTDIPMTFYLCSSGFMWGNYVFKVSIVIITRWRRTIVVWRRYDFVALIDFNQLAFDKGHPAVTGGLGVVTYKLLQKAMTMRGAVHILMLKCYNQDLKQDQMYLRRSMRCKSTQGHETIKGSTSIDKTTHWVTKTQKSHEEVTFKDNCGWIWS